MEVGRSFDEIDQKVKKLNESLKLATSQTKELDKAVQLNPKNTEAVTNKMKSLQNQVGLTTQKVTLLKQKQLEATKAFQNGEIAEKEYAKIQVAVLKAENELQKYNNELKKTANSTTLNNINKLSKGFNNVENSLKKSQKTLKTFSKLALSLVTTVTASITAFATQTNKLNESSKALEVNIEKLQLQRNIYKQITGDASNYDSALTILKNIMTSIALGQGSAYLNIMKKLGVSTKDNAGNTKELSQVYDEILIALSEMENTTLRNSLAYELFGENAVNILEVMQTSSDVITELNEQQMQLGITTEQQAQSAEKMQVIWDELKTKFMGVSAELAESLLPLIQTLSEFVINNILPILTSIANWFTSMSPGQQKFTLFLLLIIILLPKVVAIITAIVGVIKAITLASYGAAGGIGAVSAASTPLIPIALAVVAVILVLATLFAFLTGRSKELSSSLNSQAKQMSDIQDTYSEVGSDFEVNSKQVSENSNASSVDVHVQIDAYGETEMAQENAELVADILAEKINKQLGGKI